MSQSFHIGQKLSDELVVPFDKTKGHPTALTTKKYELMNASGGPKDATHYAILKGFLGALHTGSEMSQISQCLPLLKKLCQGV